MEEGQKKYKRSVFLFHHFQARKTLAVEGNDKKNKASHPKLELI